MAILLHQVIQSKRHRIWRVWFKVQGPFGISWNVWITSTGHKAGCLEDWRYFSIMAMASLSKGHMTNMTSNWILQISQNLKIIGISKRGQGACHWLKISAAVTLAMSAAGVLNVKMDMHGASQNVVPFSLQELVCYHNHWKMSKLEMIN